jgi:hypothetical protein
MSRELTKKSITGEGTFDEPSSILFNLRGLWYASSMIEKLCDDKDVILVVDDTRVSKRK